MEGTEQDPANIGNIQNVMGLLFSSAIFVGTVGWLDRGARVDAGVREALLWSPAVCKALPAPLPAHAPTHPRIPGAAPLGLLNAMTMAPLLVAERVVFLTVFSPWCPCCPLRHVQCDDSDATGSGRAHRVLPGAGRLNVSVFLVPCLLHQSISTVSLSQCCSPAC